jgi:hypothetical protein
VALFALVCGFANRRGRTRPRVYSRKMRAVRRGGKDVLYFDLVFACEEPLALRVGVQSRIEGIAMITRPLFSAAAVALLLASSNVAAHADLIGRVSQSREHFPIKVRLYRLRARL